MTKQGYNMAIKIPVSAQFDAADLKQQIQMVNDQIRILASQVGQANKQKFEPINVKSKDDLNAFIKQMQKLLSIQTELKQTMSKTGQGATNPLMADWSKMYTDQAVRIKKMQAWSLTTSQRRNLSCQHLPPQILHLRLIAGRKTITSLRHGRTTLARCCATLARLAAPLAAQ